jgi:hypothetical protein
MRYIINDMEIKEYVNILITIIGGLISVVGFLAWRILRRIEEKLEQLHLLAHNCRESLPERFMTRNEHGQFQIEFNNIWEAINYHAHDHQGRVIR